MENIDSPDATTSPEDPSDSLLPRFSGEHGKTRLLETLCDQILIRGERAIADALLPHAKCAELSAGKLLIKQGGNDNDIFLIISGALDIVVNGRLVATRYPGEHVGEMALIESAARRSASVVAKEVSLVVQIGEQEFSTVANNYPQIWRRLAVELSQRLKERNKFHQEPRNQPVVFLGSSTEGLETTRDLQSHFSHDPFIMKPWTNGVFSPSATSIESLVRAVQGCDFGVMIITPDDQVTSRQSTNPAPRDNVIFELGLLIGTLGRERTFMVLPRNVDLKIPTDLLGVTPILYDLNPPELLSTRLATVAHELRKLIRTIGPR